MSERDEWKAVDADEALAAYEKQTGLRYEPDTEAAAVARHFGYEVRVGMPTEGDYWALEPRCVIGQWYRKPGEKWSCLDCSGGSYAFDSSIREEWLRLFRDHHIPRAAPTA